MNRHLRALSIAAAAAVALTGCVKMEVNLELQSDDTVDGTMIIAVQEGLGEMLSGMDESGGEVLTDEEAAGELFGGDAASGFDNPVQEEAYNQDGWVGTKVTFEGEALNVMSEDNAEFTIVREGDEFIVSGPYSSDVGEDEGSEALLDGAEMSMSVTFPGAVSEHNGTLEGNTVTWDLLNPPGELFARGDATGSSGSDFPFLLIAALALAAIAVAAVVTVVVVRSRANAGSTDDLGTGTPAPPAPPAGQAFDPDKGPVA